MILADKKDYKNGYMKHISAYRKLMKEYDTVISRELLLVYSVECGLKYKLLERWHINSKSEIQEIIQDKKNIRHNILCTHNLEKIIKELGQEGQFKFPHVKTTHDDQVSIETFHEMQRYGIREAKKDTGKNSLFEQELKKVAEWIEEEI